MAYFSLDSGTRILGIELWILDHGILQGDLSYYEHGSQVWICLISNSPLSQFGSNSTIFLWTNTSLGYIASAVGNPLHLDSLTANQSKISFVRICVEVGVECDFPKSVLLDMGNDKYTKIRIEYPWAPHNVAPQCCSVFGFSFFQRALRVDFQIWPDI